MSEPKHGERAGALRRYRPYPAYKDSGVEWLGEIPAGWEVKRLRFVSECNPLPSEVPGLPGDTEVSFVPMEAVGERGGLSLEMTKPLADVKAGYTYFRDGDIVLAKITPCFENGKGALAAGLMNGIAFGTTELHVLRTTESVDGRFLFYVTLSDAFRRLGEADMYGAGGQKRVPESFVRNFSPALPSVPEQRAIAAFLDRETARIDALVAKKERLIELLQEKRTALITRAVTKGLDPRAPMKDSGVEWLGEIPAHWEVKPLRWALSVRSGEALDNSEFELTKEDGLEVAVIGGNGVMGYTNRANTDTACIAIGRVGALCGNVHLVNPPAWITDNALVASGIRGFDRPYLALLLRVLDLNRWASQNAQPLITGGFVKAQRVCAPPEPEQRAIAAFLDRKTAKIDALVAKVREAIERLKELRTALISAAVTGKIDVREEVA